MPNLHDIILSVDGAATMLAHHELHSENKHLELVEVILSLFYFT